MPKILGLKKIDGAIWVKLDIDPAVDPSPVYLHDEADKQAIIGEERVRCIGIINAARIGNIDSDLRAIRSWIESGDWYLEKE